MSIQNVLLKQVLRFVGKPIYASEHTLLQRIARMRKKEIADPPAKLQRTCQIERETWREVTCYTVRPGQGKGANGHMLYLHGGAYVFEMNAPRWPLLGTLINRSDVSATVPLYPLAPEHTYRDTYPWLLALYQHLCDTYKPENLTIVGDSAGGGMALSLVQQAVAVGLPHPKQTLLMSPWLDLTLQNPTIRQYERADPTLASAGLRAAARWWAGGDDLASPVLSPLNGSLNGIGPLLLTIGTDELMYPDTLVFQERALAAGVDLEFIEKDSLAHLFMLMPIPEARPVIDRFVERLKHASRCSS